MFKLEKELLPPYMHGTANSAVQRVVGLEPGRALNGRECDIIVMSTDEESDRTYLETITTDFGAKVGTPTTLCTLPKVYDIVHCSCSTDRTMICFTERIPRETRRSESFQVIERLDSSSPMMGGPSSSPQRSSMGGSAANFSPKIVNSAPDGTGVSLNKGADSPQATPMATSVRSIADSEAETIPTGSMPTVEDAMGSPGVSSTSNIMRSSSSLSLSVSSNEQYTYKLHIYAVNCKKLHEITTKNSRGQPDSDLYMAGYFIPKPPSKDKLHTLIRAVDQRQIETVTIVERGMTVQVVERPDNIMARAPFWHQWNPHTRHFAFMIYRDGYYCLRIVDFEGGPDKKQAAFQITTPKIRKVLFSRPLTSPFVMGHTTPNVAVNIILLKTRYECMNEDYALCHQYLGNGADPRRFKKVIVTISMLRTLKYLDIVFDISEMPHRPSDYRVTFVQLHGMIAVYMPGAFVHYVDVAHRERGPVSLFTVHLKESSPALSTLPTPVGDWVFVPNSLKIVKFELTRFNVWRWVTKMLHEHGDLNAIRHAMHVATTHFPAAERGMDQTFNNVQQIISSDYRCMTPSVVSGIVLGEAYDRTRGQCLRAGSDYWACVPMADERREFDDTVAPENRITREQGRWIHVESRERFYDMQETQNTLADWFLPTSINRPSRRSFITKFFNKDMKNAPQERLSFTPLVSLAMGVRIQERESHVDLFRSNVANQLRMLGVPKEDATKVANTYSDAMATVVNELLMVIVEPTMTAARKYHILHNVSIGFDNLGYPQPSGLIRRLTELSSKLLPRAAFLEGMRSGLYRPSVRESNDFFDLGLDSSPFEVSPSTGAGGRAQNSGALSPGGSTNTRTSSSAVATPNSLSGFDPEALSRAQRLAGPLSTGPTGPQWGALPVFSGDQLADMFTTSAVSGSEDTHARKVEAASICDPAPILQAYKKQLPSELPAANYNPVKLWIEKYQGDRDLQKELSRKRQMRSSVLSGFMNRQHAATAEVDESELLRRARAAECLSRLYHPFNAASANGRI